MGEPYDLPMTIDTENRAINMPTWKQLSEHQQQHVRAWVGAIADTIIRDQTGRN